MISPELDDKKILTRRQQERVLGSFLLASIVDVYSLGEMSNYDSGIAGRHFPLPSIAIDPLVDKQEPVMSHAP